MSVRGRHFDVQFVFRLERFGALGVDGLGVAVAVSPNRIGIAIENLDLEVVIEAHGVDEVLGVVPELMVLLNERDDNVKCVVFDEEGEAGVAVEVTDHEVLKVHEPPLPKGRGGVDEGRRGGSSGAVRYRAMFHTTRAGVASVDVAAEIWREAVGHELPH